VTVRPARPADADAIAAIHNDGIADRVATFETAHQDAAGVDFGAPLLVAEDGDGIAGWAKLSAYSTRHYYAGVAEASIYVARAARGRGVGRELLGALVAAAESAGYLKLVALVFPENAASVALFAHGGFRTVGTYERHSRLDGAWRDVVLLERLLGVASTA
jgi:L-amino acid N-acyltransferase YncA